MKITQSISVEDLLEYLGDRYFTIKNEKTYSDEENDRNWGRRFEIEELRAMIEKQKR